MASSNDANRRHGSGARSSRDDSTRPQRGTQRRASPVDNDEDDCSLDGDVVEVARPDDRMELLSRSDMGAAYHHGRLTGARNMVNPQQDSGFAGMVGQNLVGMVHNRDQNDQLWSMWRAVNQGESPRTLVSYSLADARADARARYGGDRQLAPERQLPQDVPRRGLPSLQGTSSHQARGRPAPASASSRRPTPSTTSERSASMAPNARGPNWEANRARKERKQRARAAKARQSQSQSVQEDEDDDEEEEPRPRRRTGLGVIVCAWCQQEGHLMNRCAAAPDKNGYIYGCARHNSSKHEMEDCSLREDDNMALMISQYVTMRAGLPPLSGPFTWEDLAWQHHEAHPEWAPDQLPLTAVFASNLSNETYDAFDYALPQYGQLGSDPNSASWEAFAAYMKSQEENDAAMTGTTTAEAPAAEAPPAQATSNEVRVNRPWDLDMAEEEEYGENPDELVLF